ncbi:flagellar basal body protein FlgE [Selenomonas sp. FOBRC6]|uniref:flagellar hook-basal body complex protein n=1 Tax=Selenomonas sp. FOBRC6 TaxID=936572 RepID=UPI000277F5C5|nr:flagellar hook-basal body complex protein [Selenomonas sp. FOBRC6]EJO17672.1 flagellar basal body protein FlgE [Selenomonas sp. FOBRC6]
MMRSMFSGVSGLKGHQTRMDVIGNNIANVNTTGFKASRVTFADMISQNLSGASSPTGTIGGVNPKQVGLGMSVASTDLIYTNGSVQQTGKNTDVAISRGDGLFVVSRGEQKFYTRNGAFGFDAEGNLTIPSTGLYVQGYMANNGVLNVAGDNTTKIRIPAGKSMDATTTATASYTKNLNATTPGYQVANVLVRYADGTSETTNSYTKNEVGKLVLTMDNGRKIYLSSTAPAQTVGTNPTGALYSSTISNVTASASGHVDAKLEMDSHNPSSPKEINGSATTVINRTGGTSLTSGTYAFGDVFNISGKITNIVSSPPSDVVLTLDANNTITPRTPVTIKVPNPTSFTYAVGDTYTGQLKVTSLTPQAGATVTTADGNSAVLSAALSTPITSASATYTHTGGAADGTIKSITRESIYQLSGKKVSSVVLNTKSGTSIDGLIGKSYNAGDTFYPSVATTVTVYDSLGAKHDVPVVYTKAANNKWTISLGSGGDTFNITEADGTVTTVALTKTDLNFDTAGGYVSGSASLNLTYTNGAAPQQVAMNLAAITQYSGTSTISATSDGNAAGTLSSVDIDSTGVITGTYTNGVRQKEAQIAMAQFNNPSGLTKMGGNLYQESNNSGTRTISGASDIGTELTTSALEMSNVDIADQFSDMIITQRGFQSNSKIITVSDEMLETLINMKR